ncbi:DUF3078 domain-containing protein [Robertkochia aurantiaca]|uniref:DUF3078 domain-containing protein n=1 Tax=Robertkochia aurantiaca TaxID=2873700 RepID=UPI001CCEC23F|nr:DUF3078 domain-containing protein [Robertkochia sp. 3YJGBD-33]
MKYGIALVILLLTFTLHAQNDNEILRPPRIPDTALVIKRDTINLNRLIREYQPPPPRWTEKNRIGLDVNEIAFVNWNAGGNNAISARANALFLRNYKFRNVQWNNEMILKYGVNAQEGQSIRKTDDEISVNSTMGYKMDQLSDWYFSGKLNFNTQFSNGFRYPDTETPISTFMAPGYLFLGIGAEYSPEDKDFNLYVSPVTQKSTFVLDQRLADQGAFGVRPARFNGFGMKIEDGQRVYTEIGFLLTNSYQTKILENIYLSNRINLYTDYLNNFGNIDVNWIVDLEFRVNELVKATFGFHVIYDDDVKFVEVTNANGETSKYGARIQFKQLLGIGVVYDF